MYSNTGGLFDPWDTLRNLTHVRISWVDMPDGGRGRTDGERTIWLHRGQQQTERRCALAHELVHLFSGHTGCQEPAVERLVRAHTARLLISHQQLISALAWTSSPAELAEDLWVTLDVIEDRLAGLTASERAHINQELRGHFAAP